MNKFMALGVDVHYLILEQLFQDSPKFLLQFARVSKACEQLAIPFIYRRVELGLPNGAGRILETKLVQDGQDGVARHVRHVAVKGPVKDDELNKILDNLGNLRAFSWEDDVSIGTGNLEKIQTRWPNIELSVKIRARGKKVMHKSLLSAQQLRSLDYPIYVFLQNRSHHSKSEYGALTKILVENKRLRRLSLTVEPLDGYQHRRTAVAAGATDGPLHFHVDADTKLPPLEELIIRNGDQHHHFYGQVYDFSMNHCLRLLGALDADRLRKLELPNAPLDFFKSFRGFLPGLRWLKFNIPESWHGGWNNSTDNQRIVTGFITSLTNLEHLEITNCESIVDDFFPAIHSHRKTLKTLPLPLVYSKYYQAQVDAGRGDTGGDYLAYPALEHVGLKVTSRLRVSKTEYTEEVDKILQIPKLTEVDLWIHVPRERSIFSDAYRQNAMGTLPMPPLDEAGCKEFAVKIMKKRSDAWGLPPLRKLNAHLTRTGYEDRGQSYTVKSFFSLTRSEYGEFKLHGPKGWGWESSDYDD